MKRIYHLYIDSDYNETDDVVEKIIKAIDESDVDFYGDSIEIIK